MIFGSPRSGTTWLGKIFDSHPEFHYFHEPEIARPTSLPQFPQSDASLRAQAADDLTAWQAACDLRTAGTRPIFRKRGESALRYLVRSSQIYLYKGLERLDESFAFKGPVLTPFCRPATVRVIKTVNMLGRAGLCMEAEPTLRAIHLLRHPCGQVASMLRGITRFGERDELACGALLDSPLGRAEELTDERIEAMGAVERLAWKWAAFNEAAFEPLAASERAVTVSYEGVTANPLAEMRRLFHRLGLSWADEVEQFIRASTAQGATQSHYGLKRDPKAAAQRWRKELAAADIGRIEEICGRTKAGQLAMDQAG